MNTSGMILPQFVVDVADVEHHFSTARTFLYYMNRLSGEKWEKEQLQDGSSSKPITLTDIENGITYQDVRVMLANEHGRSNYNAVTDIQLCHEIDNVLAPSIYSLSEEVRGRLGQYLQRKYRVAPAQVRRCLALPSDVQSR